MKRTQWMVIGLALLLISGCGGNNKPSGEGETGGEALPVFTLAWSEYPSWSVFGVADELGLINKKKGELGSVEKEHGVDIVLEGVDYDSCITMYAAGTCDAACLTNMDSLAPGLSRPAVGILPTSTSDGADALLVTSDITTVQDLKGKKVYGLEKSVSEYTFARNLELLGEKEADYEFANQDPGVAALAMQQKQESHQAIVVWNPFVMETLSKRDDVKVLFDSTKIPGEIIDMVVCAKSSLEKPGGDKFARALIDAFYQVNEQMAAEDTRDVTLQALGAKFSNLDVEAMKKVVVQTKFYDSPEKAIALFESAELKTTMDKVVGFCVDHQMVDGKPTVAYGSGDAALLFDAQYLK